ncbi:hypothetical protein [Stenotrophomonas sp. VV52]|uniref:hypothetical protein n=1 Tax=Stenotrophomonas sp. VV52 TaxID=2066958 RepID=UPI000C9E8C8A|nr:hypothetical protein [Stenotrophomonas sp. VV52]
MAGKKIQLKDQLGRVIHLNSDATDGATLGKNLYGADGKLLTADQIINPPASNQSASATVWKLIREVPANIQKLAKLATNGFAVRQASGEWVTRSLQAGVGIDITNPDSDAGDPTISLEDLPDSGVGAALVKITRDGKGRVEGTQPASTTDLAEGSNLYFTDARADARITAQKGQPNGLATLGADLRIPSAQLPAIAITETFVVGSQAAQLALTAQEGDVAVRTDLSKSYIKNSGTSGTMSDWTELLAPSGGSVLSVNARTGAVVVPDFVIKATAPVAGDFGRAIIDGDRWFNSTSGVDYIRVAGAWVHDNAAALSRYMPAYLANGSPSPVPLNADGTVPAYLANGTSSPFATQA